MVTGCAAATPGSDAARQATLHGAPVAGDLGGSHTLPEPPEKEQALTFRLHLRVSVTGP